MTSPPPTTSRDQQFCLRWNNYQSNLTQVFNQLFQSESFVDVTLACEGHSVKAHRIVLSACSPYFLTVLTETPCSHPVIILQGVKWTELKAVVEFMYKGEINICQEQLASLLRVAESLKIRGLADVGGEEAEAVLTSPSDSPRASSHFWSEDTPRKRRRLSEEPRSRSRSRSASPRSHTPQTPPSGSEPVDTMIDHPGPHSRGSSAASNPPPSLPSPSLASSLSSLAHLHGPMPPPGPPLPPHLAHLPPLSPLSPLLNMHPMPRHHSPEDFEIRPGIAEMIREEERARSSPMAVKRRRDFPDVAKLLESTHHWIANPMADQGASLHPHKEEKNRMKEALRRKFNKSLHTMDSCKNRNVFTRHQKEPRVKDTFPCTSDNTKHTSRTKGPSKWTQEDLASALLMVRNGTPIKPAAERFNIPVMTLWRRTRALGLVSSKVQCGFRYSTSRGNFNSLYSLSFHSKPPKTGSKNRSKEIFLKERSPLTESNYKVSQVVEEAQEGTKRMIEETSHKENSRGSLNATTLNNEDLLNEKSNKSDQNSYVPTKEFLVWLNCLGHEPSPSATTDSTVNNEPLKFGV